MQCRVKSGKSVKSNAELYNELQEFVSTAGLPQGHVPSFKELSHHGRLFLLLFSSNYMLIRDSW